MNCSSLSAHLYNMHIIDDPSCPCGHEYEDCLHCLIMQCPLFIRARTVFMNTINTISTWNLNILLYGDDKLSIDNNKLIVEAVHRYLSETGRFDNN